jgi:hypothetical protein
LRTIVAISTETCSTSPMPSGPSISRRVLRDAHLVPRVAEHDVDSPLARLAVDRPGIGRIDGERLLGEDVDPRRDRGACLLGTQRARAGQRDDVGPGLDDLAPVRRGVREAEAAPHLRELGGIAAIHDPRLHLWTPQEARDVGEHGPGPGADHAEAEAASLAAARQRRSRTRHSGRVAHRLLTA